MKLFKRYYKEAIDDIKPNRELIDKIFDRAEKNTKPKVATVYRYGMAVAAMLVLAVSVYSYPKITEYARLDKNEVRHVEITEETVDYSQNEKADITEKSKIVSVGGGASSAKMRETPAAGKGETGIWSMEKYIDYIGIDVAGVVNIPSDMKNMSVDTVYITMQDGEIKNDLMTFVFSGEDRTVLIETAKTAEVFFNHANYTEESFGSALAKIYKTDEFEYDAFLEHNSVKFRICSYGLSEAELKAIIGSIAIQN